MAKVSYTLKLMTPLDIRKQFKIFNTPFPFHHWLPYPLFSPSLYEKKKQCVLALEMALGSPLYTTMASPLGNKDPLVSVVMATVTHFWYVPYLWCSWLHHCWNKRQRPPLPLLSSSCFSYCFPPINLFWLSCASLVWYVDMSYLLTPVCATHPNYCHLHTQETTNQTQYYWGFTLPMKSKP